MEFVTFFSAMMGYAGLAVLVLLTAYGHLPRIAWTVVAYVIAVHVFLVWAFRYEWQLSQATRNGYAGFIVFHTALVLIGFSALVKRRIAVVLMKLAFLVVTIGALGAVFRYDVVRMYRVPVIAFAAIGGLGLVQTLRAFKSARQT